MQNPKEILIHDIDLSEFGKTPTGDSMFRVVWGPSRTEKILVKRRIKNPVIEAKRYPNEELWILEKWQSALDWAGTPAGHASMCSGAPIEMEYPADGEYERCDVSFPNNEAVREFAALYVRFLVMGKTEFTEQDRMKALKLREQIKEDDITERTSEAIHDVLSGPNYAGNRVKLYDAAGNIIH